MTDKVQLREVTVDDIPIFYEQQQDPVAQQMVGITPKEPVSLDAFLEKWARICGDDSNVKKTVLFQGQVAGNVLCFVASWSGLREVGYWIGREFWGQGVATEALAQLLALVIERPLYAHVAKHNTASVRVLTKCGFTFADSATNQAEVEDEEHDEFVLVLRDKSRVRK